MRRFSSNVFCLLNFELFNNVVYIRHIYAYCLLSPAAVYNGDVTNNTFILSAWDCVTDSAHMLVPTVHCQLAKHGLFECIIYSNRAEVPSCNTCIYRCSAICHKYGSSSPMIYSPRLRFYPSLRSHKKALSENRVRECKNLYILLATCMRRPNQVLVRKILFTSLSF